MRVKHVQLWICEACLNAEGETCNTPGCIFIRMKPPEVPMDENQYTVLNEIEED